MADQEVIKHTKKIQGIWNSDEHSIWHKVKEFLIEIIIIVFAVSLSIWFHDRSEHSHQQKEVKEFLLGLKDDLTKDMKEMEADKKSFRNSDAALSYITSIKINETLNQDSLKVHEAWIFNLTELLPNNGRFEGFKSSGKIGTIENKLLQDAIMDLYQENIPTLIMSTDNFSMNKQRLFDYVEKNQMRETNSITNLYKILASNESKNICSKLKNLINEIIYKYNACISKINRILSEIDKEHKN